MRNLDSSTPSFLSLVASVWGCKSHGSRLRETETCLHTGFGMGYGKLRTGLGVREGQSVLRAGRPPYVEVEGFPFWSWALGSLPYLQAGSIYGGSGLGPSAGVARAVRASPPFLQEAARLSPQQSCPSRKDTDTIILPTNCDSPTFRPGWDPAARNSMCELKTSPDTPPHSTWASCANPAWSRVKQGCLGGCRQSWTGGEDKGSGERWRDKD